MQALGKVVAKEPPGAEALVLRRVDAFMHEDVEPWALEIDAVTEAESGRSEGRETEALRGAMGPGRPRHGNGIDEADTDPTHIGNADSRGELRFRFGKLAPRSEDLALVSPDPPDDWQGDQGHERETQEARKRHDNLTESYGGDAISAQQDRDRC